MDGTTGGGLTEYESVVFLDCFGDLPDPRMAGKVDYPLEEVLLLCLAATVSGATSITAMALFGATKLDFLRRFRPFANGTPSHDHLGDILAALDPTAFQTCFVRFAAKLTGLPVEAINIDGKTMRGTRKKGGKAAHILTAFAARERLVLAQRKVDDKSNEITAIPALLDMVDVAGAIVTIDAMGTQRDIAEKIVSKGADYVLALKGNQSALCADAREFVAEQRSVGWRDAKTTAHETVDGDHGRIETRRYVVVHDLQWLVSRHPWAGLRGLAVVESTREKDGKVETETRLYITSSPLDAERLAPFIRGHWAIENSLHWTMDMNFRDDECRARTGHAPANLATIRHVAQNLLRVAPGKLSMQMKTLRSALDDAFRANVLKAGKAA
jgi:predicted transposase YbfD/YdcC